jgi:hypothetical protein
MARTRTTANAMETEDQAPQRKSKNDEEPWVEDSGQEWEQEQEEQKPEDETTVTMKEKNDTLDESDTNDEQDERGEKNVFVNGLAVGLGIGFIITFVIMWLAVFFSPQLPSGATYQTLLSIFIYPMVYLLAVGLIALTAGTVREYYVPKINSGTPTFASAHSDDS